MRVFDWVKREIIGVIPVVMYFFVAFTIINLTFAEEGVRLSTFVGVVIGALLIGKIMLVVDNLPFLDAFPDKPLIYNTVWKTFVYTFFAFSVRICEILVSLFAKYKSSDLVRQQFLGEIPWSRFWVIHVWILMLAFVFVVSKETINAVGKDRLRRIFFGK